jgi:hypothetical protein
MMYWIVFALFTTLETFLDIFFSWFPFYYEIKILFILWVLSPATRGSSLLYKKVVHPMLQAREKEIDELIEKTKQQGYTTFLHLFSAGFDYASTLFVTSALRGQSLLGTQLKKSLSLNDMGQEPPVQHQRAARKPATAIINEDDDNSSDLYEEESTEKVRGRAQMQSHHSPPSAVSYTNLNGNSSPVVAGADRKPSLNAREYEFIDDNMWMPDELDPRKTTGRTRKATSSATSTASTVNGSATSSISSRHSNYASSNAASAPKPSEVKIQV